MKSLQDAGASPQARPKESRRGFLVGCARTLLGMSVAIFRNAVTTRGETDEARPAAWADWVPRVFGDFLQQLAATYEVVEIYRSRIDAEQRRASIVAIGKTTDGRTERKSCYIVEWDYYIVF